MSPCTTLSQKHSISSHDLWYLRWHSRFFRYGPQPFSSFFTTTLLWRTQCFTTPKFYCFLSGSIPSYLWVSAFTVSSVWNGILYLLYLENSYALKPIDVKKEMATHSGILALRIPWTEEPGWLWFIVLQRVRHDWSNLACTPKTKLKSHFLWGLLCWLFCTVTFLVTPTVIIAYVSHLALILSFDIAYTTILNCYLTLYVCLFWVPTCDRKERAQN